MTSRDRWPAESVTARTTVCQECGHEFIGSPRHVICRLCFQGFQSQSAALRRAVLARTGVLVSHRKAVDIWDRVTPAMKRMGSIHDFNL